MKIYQHLHAKKGVWKCNQIVYYENRNARWKVIFLKIGWFFLKNLCHIPEESVFFLTIKYWCDYALFSPFSFLRCYLSAVCMIFLPWSVWFCLPWSVWLCLSWSVWLDWSICRLLLAFLPPIQFIGTSVYLFILYLLIYLYIIQMMSCTHSCDNGMKLLSEV